MPTVVASDDPMIDADRLRERLDATVRVVDTAAGPLAEVVGDADALVVDVNTAVDAAALSELSLTVVARAGVGVDNVDVAAAAEAGTVVTNVPDYCREEVATHTLALLLDCARNVTGYDRDVRAGGWGWERGPALGRLSEERLGLISFGPIARRLTEAVSGIGVEVVANDPYVDPETMREHGVEPVDREELLETARYVVTLAPLTPETEGMIDADALDRMREDAVLINTGRGGLIDEAALAAALREAGGIAAAGLDVLREEPPGEDAPLVGLDDCVVTPHAAWYSEPARDDLNDGVAANVAAALAGETPPDRIDPDADWL
jgi:D-3-phosphoglycerate dehydrogenase